MNNLILASLPIHFACIHLLACLRKFGTARVIHARTNSKGSLLLRPPRRARCFFAMPVPLWGMLPG